MSFADNPYTFRRSPVFANNMVSTSQPLAAQAGLGMLDKVAMRWMLPWPVLLR